jgi:mono/diheme cytochrome c family protein
VQERSGNLHPARASQTKTQKKSVSWLLLLLFAAGTSLVAQQGGAGAGAAIFKGKCVLCHGTDGTGNTPLGKQLQAANLRSKDVQKLSNAQLQQVVHDGKANMPAFADQLSQEDISNVIKYVRTLGKAGKK